MLPTARFTALNSTRPEDGEVHHPSRTAAVRLQNVKHGVLEAHVGVGVRQPALQQGSPAEKRPHGLLCARMVSSRIHRIGRIGGIKRSLLLDSPNPANPKIRQILLLTDGSTSPFVRRQSPVRFRS